MATITPTVIEIKAYGESAHLVQWLTIGDADTCTAIEMPGHTVRSAQIAGTFGSATVVIQGSNDGTNYVTLTDPQGNAISKSAAALEQIEENTRYLKPNSTGGTGSSTNVSVLLRRPK